MLIENKTILVDGFDSAIIGYTDDGRIVYSKIKMIEATGLSFIEAVEHLDFNIWNAYIGEFMPIYLNDFDADLELIEQYNA
jgi:hypothetical protein